MSMMILWSISGVHASTSDVELACFEETIQKSLDRMTCNESKSFIQDHFVFQTQDSSSADFSSHLKEGIDSCNITKSNIHDVLERSLKTSGNENGDVHAQTFLPPFTCLACVASLCMDHDFGLDCCASGNQPLCYFCP